MLQPNPLYMWYVCDMYVCEKLMFFAGETPGELKLSWRLPSGWQIADTLDEGLHQGRHWGLRSR
jgi:hypothetical protein